MHYLVDHALVSEAHLQSCQTIPPKIHVLHRHSSPSGPVPGLGVGPLGHWGASDPLLQPVKQVVVLHMPAHECTTC